MTPEHVDCVVIGGGVIGLACAAALAASGREVILLEKENSIGQGTSSRNSEVIHAGIYYAAGSLKARLCRTGRDLLYRRCEEHHIPFRRTGKLIVATSADQITALDGILQCATANDVNDLHWVSGSEINRLEPEVKGVTGLFSPSTGIVDSHALMQSLEGELHNYGGMVVLRAPVAGGQLSANGMTIDVGGDEPISLRPRLTINAAGLHAPAIMQALAGTSGPSVPTARYAIGHYYSLTGRSPCRHLVYPVPEPGGLGIHLTLDLAGQARFGPDVRWIDAIDYQFDDSRKAAFVAAIKSYLPDLDESRLLPAYTGVRPKIEMDGTIFPDFRIDGPKEHGVPGLINLFGIESPGLTSALAIGELVRALGQSMAR